GDADFVLVLACHLAVLLSGVVEGSGCGLYPEGCEAGDARGGRGEDDLAASVAGAERGAGGALVGFALAGLAVDGCCCGAAELGGREDVAARRAGAELAGASGAEEHVLVRDADLGRVDEYALLDAGGAAFGGLLFPDGLRLDRKSVV